jgi:tetratricopeptide (TPR) repeat protein
MQKIKLFALKFRLLSFLLLASFWGFSQSKYVISGSVNNTDMARREPGVNIKITANGAPVSNVITSNSGKFSIPLDYGKKYKVEFSKPGLAARFLYIDLADVNVEDVPAGNMIQEFSMSMFGEIPGADLSFLKTMPTTTFYMDTKRMESSYDHKQAADVQKLIDAVLAKKDALKAAQDEKIHQYEQLMTTGDQNFAGQKYQDALKNYSDALAILPDEALPKQKIEATKAKIKALEDQKNAASKEANYNAAILIADKAFIEKNWTLAQSKYEEALKIKPEEQHPTQRIIEIDQILTNIKKAELEAKQKEEQYNNLINAANNLRDQKQYENAKAKYNEALKIKDEQFPKDQITAIDLLIKKEAEEKAKQQAYDAAMAAASTLYGQNKLEEALAKYKEASGLKPSEQTPKDKIAEINQKIADLAAQKAKEKAYTDAISIADNLFTQNKFPEAKTAYQNASTLKPDEAYPKNQITLIDQKIKELEAKQQADKAYADKIASADAKFSANAYEEAKNLYTEAQKLKPTETYPSAQIKIIDAKVAEIAKQEQINQQYSKLITDADLLFSQNKLEDALNKYKEASGLKPEEQMPKDKIALITKQLTEMAAQKKIEQDYSNAINAGQSYLSSGDLDNAKTQYTVALGLKPAESLPKEKLAEITQLIAEKEKQAILDKKYKDLVSAADNFFNAENYTEAKSKYEEAKLVKQDLYLDQRIKAINDKLAELAAQEAKKKAYNEKIIVADAALDRKELDNAKKSYEEALSIDPSQSYPKEKIKEIATIIANQQSAAEREKKFNEIVAMADQLSNDKKLEQALAKYEEALVVKADPGVQQKIDALKAQINILKDQANKDESYQKAIDLAQSKENSGDLNAALAAYKQAQSIKPAETLPAQKITEIQNKLLADKQNAAIDQQFDQAIKEGDALFNAGNYQEAKNKYVLAGSFKNDPIVPQKIALAEEKMKAETANQLESNYQKILSKANGYKASKDWENAIKYYERALSIKPDDTIPKNAIDEIHKIQAEELANKAHQADIDKQFNDAMQLGQQKLELKNYTEALTAFVQAKNIKPNDDAAQAKIDEVNKLILAQMSNEQSMAKYTAFIKEGDKSMLAQNYTAAIESYKNALAIKPEDATAQHKIAEAQAMLGKLTANEKTLKFNEWVKKANEAYIEQRYEAALNLYTEAQKIIADNKQVNDRISEIKQILDNIAEKNNKNKETEAAYKETIAQADSKFVGENWNDAQKLYQKALTIKPSDQYASDQLQLSIDKQKAETNKTLEKQYAKILAKADEYFNTESWDDAAKLYTRASELKPYDQYPKDKLDEIKRIKANGGKRQIQLANLGKQQDISVLDGEALIQKAEIIRKQKRIKKILKQGETSDEELSRLSGKSRKRNLDKNQAIDSIINRKQLHDVDLSGIKNDIIKKIDSLQKKSDIDRQLEGNYEYTSAVNTTEFVNQVIISKANQDKDGADRHEKFVDSLNITVTNMQNDAIVKRTNEYNNVSLTKEHINNIEIEKEKIESESDAIRENVAKQIEDIQNKQEKNTSQQLEKEYKEVKINNAKVVEIQAGKEKDAINHAEILSQTNAKVVALDNAMDEKARKDKEEAYLQNLEVQNTITSINANAEQNAAEKIQAHKEVIEKVKELEDTQEDHATTQALKNEDKLQNTNNQIVAITTQKEQQETNQSEQHQQVIEAVKQIEFTTDKENIERSTQEKNALTNTQQHIDNVSISSSKNTGDGGKNAQENAQKITRITENAEQNSKEVAEKKAENREKIEKLLDQLASKDIQFNETIANSLADEFPAGVTEQNYPLYDEDGLLISMVTRRIVVRNKRGDVYLRSTSKYGTTYSKNGAPIVEAIWAKETQDATLEKH